MNTLFYNFCGVPLRINAPRDLGSAEQSRLFRTEPTPHGLDITLAHCPSLPEPEGSFCGSAGDKLVYRAGSAILRRTKDQFRPQAHMDACYDLNKPDTVRALVREEDWLWATRDKYLWAGLALNQLLLHQRTLFFHASYITHQGRGILFTAPSQTGKSTQAELWRKYRGAEVVNGDKAAVSLRETPMIHSIPFSGTSGICKNRSVPLRAVVVLSQAPENTIRRMGVVEVVSAICPNVFADQTVSEEWAIALNLMLDLAASVPIYALACTPDERAVQTLEEAMK